MNMKVSKVTKGGPRWSVGHHVIHCWTPSFLPFPPLITVTTHLVSRTGSTSEGLFTSPWATKMSMIILLSFSTALDTSLKCFSVFSKWALTKRSVSNRGQ